MLWVKTVGETEKLPLNGELGQRVCVDTEARAGVASPSRTVFRRRVHLVGEVESGQVTSVVRFEPGAKFRGHDHPEGEEILVLEGVFSDERGDWTAGSYLLNPEGFRHTPASAPGCKLFVKLRQYPGPDREHVALDTRVMAWQPVAEGVACKPLYAQRGYLDSTRLEHWLAGASPGHRQYSGGVEYFVVDGAFVDLQGAYGKGTWLRLPAGASHVPRTKEGCIVYIKEGGFAYLREA